jgi:aromatic ring-opening dioxygenase catalytic subunit (LigB family)
VFQISPTEITIRQEGILILSGGLTVHNMRDKASWFEATANTLQKDFHQALLTAVSEEVRFLPLHSSSLTATSAQPSDIRKQALLNLINHPGFRACHPREEHFIPVYVAAGAGETGRTVIVSGLYGAPTFAFGLD